MLFCRLCVGLKKYETLLCPRFIPAYRRDFTCGLRRARLFSQVSLSLAQGLVASLLRLSHALLNIQGMGGAQAFTRERITMPFSSLRSDSGTDIVSRSARSLCKPAWFAGWLVVINYEQIRYKLGYVQNCWMRS